MPLDPNLFAEDNNLKTRELYLKRLSYRSTIAKLNKNNIVNFSNGAEKYLYGRIDVYHVPVIRASNFYIKKLKSARDEKSNLSAFNFVVTAFEEMARFYKLKARAATVSTLDPYLTELKAYAAYVDPLRAYRDYSSLMVGSLIRHAQKENVKIKNFQDFTDTLLLYLNGIAKTYPFTLPAYVKSRMCPMNVSGLVIEIAPIDCANDQIKIQQFVESPNWDFFVAMANDYGFMIDANVPCRLVADIRSDAMGSYMRSTEDSVGTVNSFLSMRQQRAYLFYYENFKKQLLKMYNKTKKAFLKEPSSCREPTMASAGFQRPPLTGKEYDVLRRRAVIHPLNYKNVDHLEKSFDDREFFKLYVKIRFAEEESSFSPQQQMRLEKQLMYTYKADGTYAALDKFERILNKPFDYVGSMSYYIEQRRRFKEKRELLHTPRRTSGDTPSEGGGY